MQSQEQKPGIITWCYLISSLYKDRRKGLKNLETAYQLWTELQKQAHVRGNKDGSYFATGIAPLNYGKEQTQKYVSSKHSIYARLPS